MNICILEFRGGCRIAFLQRDDLLTNDEAQQRLQGAAENEEQVTDVTCGLPVIPVKLPHDPVKGTRYTVRCLPGLKHQDGCPCPEGSHVAGRRFSGEMFDLSKIEVARSAGTLTKLEDDEGSDPHSGGFRNLANHLFGRAYYTHFRWTSRLRELRWEVDTRASEFRHALNSVSETVRLGDDMRIEEAAARHGMTVRWGFMAAHPGPWSEATGTGRVVAISTPTRALNLDFEYITMRLLPGALAEPGRVRNREGWFAGEVFWMAFGTYSHGVLNVYRLWMHPVVRVNGVMAPVHSAEEARAIPGLIDEESDAFKPPSSAVHNEMMTHFFWTHGAKWTPTKTYPDLLAFTPKRVRILEVPGMKGDYGYFMDLASKHRNYQQLDATFPFVDYDPRPVESVLKKHGFSP